MKKLLYISALVAMAVHIRANYTNTTINLAACGGRMSGGGYTSIGSLVPVGGEEMQSGSFYHQSGSTAGFILQPQTAFSGLPDEWNPDNDLDGLADNEEIAAGSSLYNKDTDEDGMDDFREWVAGTSVTNRNGVLAVTCQTLANGQKELSWFGISGRFYTFQYTDSLSSGSWQSHPFEITGNGTEISFTDTELASNRFYRVKVRKTE